MSIFSLNWFKSRKNDELDALKLEEQQLKNELLRQEIKLMSEKTDGTSTFKPPEKPYRNIKMVNDVLTVVLNDGDIITKVGATPADYQAVKNAVVESQIISICSTQEVVDEKRRVERERETVIALKKGLVLLKQLDDFEVKGDFVYLKGVNRTIPQLLVEEFLRIINHYVTDSYYVRMGGELQTALNEDTEFQSLKRFFMWCCLNPHAEVSDKLYEFLKKNAFKITKQGFFAALRNVVTLHGSPELVQFVSNSYIKVKAVWKKSPDQYEVYLKDNAYSFIHIDDTFTKEWIDCECYDRDDEEYWSDDNALNRSLESVKGTLGSFDDNCDEHGKTEITVKRTDLGKHIGNLTELYLDLPNRSENRFTDAYTKTFDIRVGRAVSMDPNLCRWNTDDCGAKGLHFTSDEIHYVGCGDESVLVLINPMKVVGIGESKGRCWEYLPIMTVAKDEATSILHDLDFDTLQLDDSYAVRELEDLAEKAKDGFVSEGKKHEFSLPHISTTDIENIVSSLQTMKDEISKRIVPLD